MADGTWAFKRVSLFRKDFDPDMGGPWYTAGRLGVTARSGAGGVGSPFNIHSNVLN